MNINLLIKNIIIITLLLWTNKLPAQQRTKQEKELSQKIGIIKGKIIDKNDGSPLPYTSIAVISDQDKSIVGGGLTNEKGAFEIKELPLGKFFLEITFVGYDKHKVENIVLTQQKPIYKTKMIALSSLEKELDEVVITAETTTVDYRIDKKVVNIGADMLAVGTNAFEIMDNIPSVNVSVDGTVSLRGGENVIILIDGRPTNLSAEEVLLQIPTDAIETIEVITNPSAKYDATGTSGILNIVLKKNKKLGALGSVNVGAGTRNKYNTSISLSRYTGKFNLYGNYAFQYTDRISEKNDNIKYENQTQTEFSNNKRSNMSHNGKFGIDYYINPANTIFYSSSINNRDFTEKGDIDYNYYDLNHLLDSIGNRKTNSSLSNLSQRHDLTYRNEFDGKQHFLEASVNFRKNESVKDGKFTNEYFNNDNSFKSGDYNKEDNRNNSNLLVTSVDYYKEQQNKIFSKFEIGGRTTLRQLDNKLDFYSSIDDNKYEIDEDRSDAFTYNENVYALYGITVFNFHPTWALQVGLRLEQTMIEFHSKLLYSTSTNSYLDYFPTINLKKDINNQNSLILNYTKRIYRPSTRQLNPMPRYEDPLTIRRGNPLLSPAYAHVLELSHNYDIKKKGTINSSLFYRHHYDQISRFILSEGNIRIATYENISSSQAMGFENNVNMKFYTWWNINSNFNIYYSILDQDNQNYSNKGLIWFTRINSSFTLPKEYFLQLVFRYYGKRITPQGHIDPMWGADLVSRKNLWEKKANISLRVSDVFNTFRFNYNVNGEGFESAGERNWETQIAYLAFSYYFGNPKNQKQRKKQTQIETLWVTELDKTQWVFKKTP